MLSRCQHHFELTVEKGFCCTNSSNDLSFSWVTAVVRSTAQILSGLHQERISLRAAWMKRWLRIQAFPTPTEFHLLPHLPRFGFTVLTSFSEAAKDGKMVMPQPNDKVRGGLASKCLGIFWDFRSFKYFITFSHGFLGGLPLWAAVWGSKAIHLYFERSFQAML